LADALCRKARDTEDPALYSAAATAIDHVLTQSPGNYDALKLRVRILLGRHQYAEALKLASQLNNKAHDDLAVWALLVDANSALGNYSEAERCAQWILDLRPGSALGFDKAASLRVIFGDFEGAGEFLDEANRRTSQNDLDQHSWFLTRKAEAQLDAGNPQIAQAILTEALKAFPESLFAQRTLARVQTALGDSASAAAMLAKLYHQVPNNTTLYVWAEALENAGNKEQAAAQFAKFETLASAQSSKPLNDNLDLIYYYCDHKNDPATALKLAEKEKSARGDYATLDAYAWALYQNGKYADAKTAEDKALSVGVRNPAYFCHAVRIDAKAGDSVSVAKYQREAIILGVNSCPTEASVESAREVTR
jgi:tetratricopeptide (TPR) repeat protein